MEKLRLHDLMRRFGVGLDTLVAFLNDKGACLSDVTPNTKISYLFIDVLENHFGRDKMIFDDSPAKTLKIPSQVSMTRQESYNEAYISTINQIERLEEKLSVCNTNEDISNLHIRLEKLYYEREVLERSQNRIEAFFKSYPEYSYILADLEIRRDKVKNKAHARRDVIVRVLKANHAPISESGELEGEPIILYIPWNKIRFYDGRVVLRYAKDIEILIKYPKSQDSYSSLLKTLMLKLPPMEVAIYHNGYCIRNQELIASLVELMSLHDNIINAKHLNDGTLVNISNIHKIPSEILRGVYPVPEIDYLKHLLNMQVDEFNYIPLYESHVSCPDAFLFTVRHGDHFKVIWESVRMAELKSTYVFDVEYYEITWLLQLLYDFITSDRRGKRYGLRKNTSKEFYGFRYSSTKHDEFLPWKQRLSELITAISKTQPQYVEDKSLISTFISCLKHSGYTDIFHMANLYDITAIAPDGTCHYFEVKDSSRELRIKESIPWILSHGHYRTVSDSDRLFIIGTHRISKEQYRSLMILRKIYNLQIQYAYFDISSSVLHEPSKSWK